MASGPSKQSTQRSSTRYLCLKPVLAPVERSSHYHYFDYARHNGQIDPNSFILFIFYLWSDKIKELKFLRLKTYFDWQIIRLFN